MRSFIQITDTNNDILRSLPLGDLSSITTYSFRVWNNYPNFNGIASIKDLKLNISYPPKQGIQTLINNECIKIRCTYSGKLSETISDSFKNFPIIDERYDILENYCYNEYEVRIDFSNLSSRQKSSVNLIDMVFNITVSYGSLFVPFSISQEKSILSDTSIKIIDNVLQKSSDSIILYYGYGNIQTTSDSTIG